MFSEVGQRRFDEMDGLYPLISLVTGIVAAAVGVCLLVFGSHRRLEPLRGFPVSTSGLPIDGRQQLSCGTTPLLPPAQDLERRRPVWEALSDLFLDTELDEAHLRHIASTLVISGYSDPELNDILYGEVYPACICNLHSFVGEWDGIDVECVERRILRNERKFWKKWRLFQPNRRMVRPDWQKVIRFVQEQRRG